MVLVDSILFFANPLQLSCEGLSEGPSFVHQFIRHSISPEAFKMFSLNFGQIFILLRRFAESIT